MTAVETKHESATEFSVEWYCDTLGAWCPLGLGDNFSSRVAALAAIASYKTVDAESGLFTGAEPCRYRLVTKLISTQTEVF